MQRASSERLQVTIKQEPRENHAVAYWNGAIDFQSPFIDLSFEEDDGLDIEMASWPARRTRGQVDDSVVLEPLVCDDEPLSPASLQGMTSPVATSDVLRLHGHRRAGDELIAKPVSPSWCAARLKDTMAAELPKCSIDGCSQPIERGGRCKRHVTGRLCQAPGCTKNMQSNGLCIRHGGGRRCEIEGCPRGAQARGKCKTHGGGVRCNAPGCMRSSQGSGLCRTHGGGKLCDFPGCKKGTQRRGKCSAHGGPRRCRVTGCDKVERGGGLCGRHKASSQSSSDNGSDTDSDEADKAAIV